MRFGSRGPRKFLRPSPCRSSRIRHRNALTKRAWKDAVQGLGNRSPLWVDSYLKRRVRCGQSQSRTSSLRPLLRMLAWRDRWSRGTKTLGTRVGQSRNMRDTENSGPCFMEKSWPRKEGHPPRRVNYIYIVSVYMRKKLIRLSQELITALMRALIVSPPPYKLTRPAGLAKAQSVYMD